MDRVTWFCKLIDRVTRCCHLWIVLNGVANTWTTLELMTSLGLVLRSMRRKVDAGVSCRDRIQLTLRRQPLPCEQLTVMALLLSEEEGVVMCCYW